MLKKIVQLYCKIRHGEEFEPLDRNIAGYAISSKNRQSKQTIDDIIKKDKCIKNFNNVMLNSGYCVYLDPKKTIFSKIKQIIPGLAPYTYIENIVNAKKYDFAIHFELSTFKNNKKAGKFYKYLKKDYEYLGNVSKIIDDKYRFVAYLEKIDYVKDDNKCIYNIDGPMIDSILIKNNSVLLCNAQRQYEEEVLEIIEEFGC